MPPDTTTPPPFGPGAFGFSRAVRTRVLQCVACGHSLSSVGTSRDPLHGSIEHSSSRAPTRAHSLQPGLDARSRPPSAGSPYEVRAGQRLRVPASARTASAAARAGGSAPVAAKISLVDDVTDVGQAGIADGLRDRARRIRAASRTGRGAGPRAGPTARACSATGWPTNAGGRDAGGATPACAAPYTTSQTSAPSADRHRERVRTRVLHPGARRAGLARERHARGRIESLPPDTGEVDLGPRVRVALAHDEAARETVLLARHEAGREPSRDADAAGEHGRGCSTPARTSRAGTRRGRSRRRRRPSGRAAHRASTPCSARARPRSPGPCRRWCPRPP